MNNDLPKIGKPRLLDQVRIAIIRKTVAETKY